MRKVLILGASASISRKIIEVFILNGDHVLATYNKTNIKIAGKKNKNYKGVQLDFNSKKSQVDFLKRLKEFGKLDIAIFLPGILLGKSLSEYTNEEINRVMNTNFSSHANILRKLLNNINNNASILFMSSISGQRGSYDPIYAASKAAQIAFIKSIATWNGSKFRINGIAPSLIQNSTMFHDMDKQRRDYHLSNSPTKKLTTKKQLAQMIFDLCGSDWENVNGHIININGGIY